MFFKTTPLKGIKHATIVEKLISVESIAINAIVIDCVAIVYNFKYIILQKINISCQEDSIK